MNYKNELIKLIKKIYGDDHKMIEVVMQCDDNEKHIKALKEIKLYVYKKKQKQKLKENDYRNYIDNEIKKAKNEVKELIKKPEFYKYNNKEFNDFLNKELL